MAEEKLNIQPSGTDDVSVLRVLLHEVKGISPVSTVTNLEISFDDEAA